MTGSNDTVTSAQQISTANSQQSSQGVLLQNYCNSVLTQPTVNLSGFTNLQQYQTQINVSVARVTPGDFSNKST
jgi:non-hemolytic enterotoxin B/C